MSMRYIYISVDTVLLILIKISLVEGCL